MPRHKARHPFWRSAGQMRSNWPSLTPAMNATHSCGVKWCTGPPGTLESRRSTSVTTNATSTQASLADPEKELLRNAGSGEICWLDSVIVASLLVCRRHLAGDEIKNRPLTWADIWQARWVQTWVTTWMEVWVGFFGEQRGMAGE